MSLSFSDYLAQAKSAIREISVQELKTAREAGDTSMLIDVREPDEVEGGVIKGAKTIPRGFLEPKIEGIAPARDTPIFLYCQGGTRSALSAFALKNMGYTNVTSIAGGMGAWKRLGYPIDHPPRMTPDQLSRYARQITLPQLGEEGQLKLLDAKVLCVGAGGLGSPLALYLAAAGVGTLGIIDNDIVDASNLQRQIVHSEGAVNTSKVESARETLTRLNSTITINAHDLRLNSENVMDIFKDYDVIVDGTDNFPTRYLINDACVFLGKPNVHGSIFHFDGQVTVFNHNDGPCYRCLYPEPPPPELAPSCAEAGVLGAMCGVIGTLQAVETMKVILGVGDTLSGRLMSVDAMRATVRVLKVRRDPNCPVCSENPEITELVDYEHFCSLNA